MLGFKLLFSISFFNLIITLDKIQEHVPDYSKTKTKNQALGQEETAAAEQIPRFEQ